MRHLPLAAILLVAAALRLYHLGADSLWYDELNQVRVARLPLWKTITTSATHHGNTPLDYVLTHYAVQVGLNEVAVRLPAALCGIAAVGLIYLLGRDLLGDVPALTAAALWAISPVAIYYSQEARFYSLATATLLLSVWLFWRAQERNTWPAWALWGLAQTVALYSHYYAAFACAVLGLWVLLYRRDLLRRFLVPAVASALLFAPWAVYDLLVVGNNAAFGQFRMMQLEHLAAAPWVMFVRAQPVPWDAPHTWWMVATWALLVAALWRREQAVWWLAALGLGGMALALGVSWATGYWLAQRQFVMWTPYVLLAVCAVVRRPTVALLVVALSAWALSGNLADTYRHAKDDWRGLLRQVMVEYQRGDTVAPGRGHPVQFYAPELADAIVPPVRVADLRADGTITATAYVIVPTSWLTNGTVRGLDDCPRQDRTRLTLLRCAPLEDHAVK